jgi:FkbM family methyltransferase
MYVVDVGANSGDLGKYLLEKNLVKKIFSIEPNNIVCSEPLSLLAGIYKDKFIYVPAAISSSNGVSKLYAPNTMSGQVSSLLEINQNGDWSESVLINFAKNDLQEYINVKTLSVETFIREYNISQIDFLKIDTQGTDLEILESFLKLTDVRVAAVEVEGSISSQRSHYINSRNSMQFLINILNKYGFSIFKIMPASSDCNEFNVIIAKSENEFERIDSILVFKNFPIFSRFWSVIGIGSKTSVIDLQKSLIKKIITSVSHPFSSYKSLLIKLTS